MCLVPACQRGELGFWMRLPGLPVFAVCGLVRMRTVVLQQESLKEKRRKIIAK
jgi:hypothetical protein